MKFLVDLYMDGYDSEEDMGKACLEFIREALDFSASTVAVQTYVAPTAENDEWEKIANDLKLSLDNAIVSPVQAARLQAFVIAYDEWAASPEHIDGPLFDKMLEARNAVSTAPPA